MNASFQNGRQTGNVNVKVDVDLCPAPWLPVRPRLNLAWLAYIVSASVNNRFRRNMGVVSA